MHGPVYSSDCRNLISKSLSGFWLEEYATTGLTAAPVQLTYTMDGAQLTNDLGPFTGRNKVVEPRAIDPLTGIPLAVSGKFQSRDLSFVAQLAFVKDYKKNYQDCFHDFLTTFNKGGLVIEGTARDPELSNFEISSCQDLSSGWKATTPGGGSSSTNFFCPQCMVSRTTMTNFKTDNHRCSLCANCNLTKCYCHSVCDMSVLEATNRNVQEYIERTFDVECKKLYAIRKKSKLNYNMGTTNEANFKNHIEYEPKSRQEWSVFKALVIDEIKLWLSAKSQSKQLKTLISRSFEEQQRALKEFVEFENSILIAKSTVDRHEAARSLAMALVVETLIPCILHMKMRLGEKIFHVIVSSALERYEEGKVDGDKKKELVIELEKCMRNKVLGNDAVGRFLSGLSSGMMVIGECPSII